jgi:predicted amidohydrolase
MIDPEIDLVKQRFLFILMVVLPELCTYGPITDMAVHLPGEVENCYRESARKNNIWLIPGSLFERDGDQVYNTAPVINPAGEVIARYRKQFPFYPYEQTTGRGEDSVVFDIPGVGRVGLLICFDSWFPETIRNLVWMGAEAIIVPNLTNTIDRNVELSIARANAVTNQVYMLNINCAGRLGFGQSIVAGPDGAVIHTASSSREIITVDLDFEHVRRVRKRGLHGLVQTLKSFRDGNVNFPVYQEGAGAGAFADLGPLEVPKLEQHTEVDTGIKQVIGE